MAGSYPDADSRKLAYDEDGTVVWYQVNAIGSTWDSFEASNITFATSAMKITYNDTDPSVGTTPVQDPNNGRHFMCFYFPELRNLYGAFFFLVATGSTDWQVVKEIEVSADTTNGVDGTWVSASVDLDTRNGDPLSDLRSGFSMSNLYRSNIYPLTNAIGVRAIRFIVQGDTDIFPRTMRLAAVHLYGTIPTTQSPDRLLIMDNDTGLEFAMPQDWGDVPRGVSLDKEVFFRNNSSTLTAGTITATFEDDNPAPGGTSNTWYTIKQGAGAFNSSLTYSGTIAPGADSDVCTIRLTVADNEDISLQEARMQVNVGSWT